LDNDTFGGSEEEMEDFDSIEFLDELVQDVYNETGVKLEYNEFGEKQ